MRIACSAITLPTRHWIAAPRPRHRRHMDANGGELFQARVQRVRPRRRYAWRLKGGRHQHRKNEKAGDGRGRPSGDWPELAGCPRCCAQATEFEGNGQRGSTPNTSRCLPSSGPRSWERLRHFTKNSITNLFPHLRCLGFGVENRVEGVR
jgi:hypothetical protein